MTEWIDWADVQTVIEYGPGTGVFTEHILTNVTPMCSFFAIEIVPPLVRGLRERFSGLKVYEGSVENVRRYCDAHGVNQVDAIVCGLPWASFSDAEQTKYLESLLRVLKPGGQFTTFAYLQGLLLPSGQRFQQKLRERFPHVEKSRIVWKNVPPAFAYRCRRG